MSLSYSVKTVVDNVVHQFILKVAEKYDLDANELLVEWEGEGCGNIKPSENVNDDLDHSKLLNMKVPELKALCKKKGLKATGKKDELISLILKGETDSEKVKTETKSPKTKLLTPTVVKKLAGVNSTTIAIRKNSHGNHEHPETMHAHPIENHAIFKQHPDVHLISPAAKLK